MSPIAAVVAFSLAIPDAPYVRSRVSNDPNAHCLWWREGTTIELRQNDRGNPDTTGETEFAAVSRSFQTWQQVMDECGNLSFREGARTSLREIGHDPTRDDNENVVLFRTEYCPQKVGSSDLCWRLDTCMNQYDCWAYGRATIALTTTTYERTSGTIYGSDIEANAYSFVFTTVDAPPCPQGFYTQSCVATDVQNTFTHEIGHLLGLDHTARAGSTMNPSAPAGETSKRLIDSGTRQFVCDAYPKGRPSRDCVINPIPPSLGSAAGSTPFGCAAVGSAPGMAALLALAFSLRRGRR